MKSILTRYQKRVFEKKGHVDLNEELVDLLVTVRFDDECGNGHNTLSVTGEAYKSGARRCGKNFLYSGCIHDEIVRAFPELKEAIEFHLCSTDGPLHYVANSLYLAGDKDYRGKRKGEPTSFETRFKFGDFPITFEAYQGFIGLVESGFDFSKAEIEELTHQKEPETYGTKYRIKGYEQHAKSISNDPWYQCSHSNKQDLEQMIECFVKYPVEIIKTPVAWSKGKAPDLEAARASAIWPDAELADFTEEKLKARLPGLLRGLKRIVESLGMTY